VGGLLVVQSVLVFFVVRTRRLDPAPDASPASRGSVDAGSIQIPSNFSVRGPVDLAGDVVVEAAPAKAPGRSIELDVPTEHVDHVLRSFSEVGFDAWETGLTVDTDEGEETLTTLRLGLESLTERADPVRPEDQLRVQGSLRVSAGAVVRAHVRATGDVTLDEAARILGTVDADRVRLGTDAVVDGEVDAAGDVFVAAGARARAIRSAADVHLEAPFPEARRRVTARRVHLGSPPPDAP
jgi:hypothetical protein